MKTLRRLNLRSVAGAAVLSATLCFNPISVKANDVSYIKGGLFRQVYTNLVGTEISDLTNSSKFPDHPDFTGLVTSFETPSQSGDLYGERLTGYLLPPVTGSYVFYLSSDDQGALYLSTNMSPAGKTLVASESTWSFPRSWTGTDGGRTNSANISAPIYLVAGRAYYVEALHKEFGGGDNFGVAWQLPGGSPPPNGSDPIAGEFLGYDGPVTNPVPPSLSFQLAFFTCSSPCTDGTLFFRNYASTGPEQAGPLLPALRVVPDSSQRYYYANRSQSVLQIDAQAHTAVEMQLPPGLPELSWPMGMTYDSTRNRELLASLGGEGFLYAYAPDQNLWSLVSSMDNRDVDSIVYHPPQDALYSFEVHRGAGPGKLFKFDAAGKYVSEFELPPIPVDVGVYPYRSEMVSVGDYLVLLIGPELNEVPPAPQQEFMYVIDPRLGSTWLTYHQFAPSNMPPTVAITSPAEGPIPVGAKSIRLTAQASDPDGSVVRVEFFANDSSLGCGVAAGTTFTLNWWSPPAGVFTLLAKATDNSGATSVSAPVHITIQPIPPPPSSLVDLAFDPLIEARVSSYLGSVSGIAVQPDQKIILGGNFETVNSVARLRLARLGSDGSVDPTFNWPLDKFYVEAVLLQPDGKVLVGGSGLDLSGKYVPVLRLNADGSVDQTFQFYAPATNYLRLTALALQSDGCVLANYIACCGPDGNGTNILSRLNPDGSLDQSFRTFATYQVDDDSVYSIALQSDGKILIGGHLLAYDVGIPRHLARLNHDGTIDSTFKPEIDGTVYIVVVLPDGRVLAGGNFTTAGGTPRPGIARLNPDGTLDSSFNVNEWIGSQAYISAMAVLPDGRILIGGSRYAPNVDYADAQFLARLSPEGHLDPSYFVRFPGIELNSYQFRLNAIVLQRDLRVLVGGQFQDVGGIPRTHLVRLLNDAAPSWVTRKITGNTVQLTATPPAGTSAYAIEEQPPADWLIANITNGVFDSSNGKVKFGPFFDAQPRTLGYVALAPPGFTGIGFVTGTASADGKNSLVTGENRIFVSTTHPADLNADWMLRIDEVTAYAAAWRTGGLWSLPPNPIPMDYVTRAASLWQGGEAYAIDPNQGGPPLWWVNLPYPTPVGPLGLHDGQPGSTVVRQVPSAYVPGQPLEVVVQVTAPLGARALAVQESVPFGWRVEGISDNGWLDTVNGQLKWGPFFNATPRTLRYQLIPPVSARGAVGLAGDASFDGLSRPVDGPSQLSSGSRFVWSSQPAQGRWTLRLHGELGTRYLIQNSTDLVHWRSVVTVTNTLGSIELPGEVSPQPPALYYRAQALP